ncbi:mask [Symbiodinium natans]|uniref:Mask protein n=1 Tax=Symbiodinium natans TaxID=878477 RepID=A0A812SYB9_9DINO|nr:mask [Symbiodinium natans]
MSAAMAKISANVAIFFTVLTSMFWLVLIFQEKGWASKTCAWYTLDLGAWKVTVSRGLVVKLLVPDKARSHIRMAAPAGLAHCRANVIMGCGASSVEKKRRTGRVSSFTMRAPIPTGVPRGTILAPDRECHDAHVKSLNRYLRKVKKDPQSFKKWIEVERFDRVAPAVAEAKPSMQTPRNKASSLMSRTRTL